MWEKIAKEMALPWRAAEAMHWQIGEIEMANRANVNLFHLAGQSSTMPERVESVSPPTSAAQSLGPIGYPLLHSHSLPQIPTQQFPMIQSQPVSPVQTRPGASSNGGGSPTIVPPQLRRRADSARSVPMANRTLLPPLHEITGPPARYNLPPLNTSPPSARR